MEDDPETPTPGRGEGEAQHEDQGQRVERSGNGEQRENDEGVEQERHTGAEEYEKILKKIYARNTETKQWDPEFNRDWITYFSGRIGDKYAGVINSIYSVEAFDEFTSKMKRDTTREFLHRTGLTQAQVDADTTQRKRLNIEVSESIEKQIVLAIVELYYRVDIESSNETFSEIEQANFMRSIRTSRDILLERLLSLQKELGEKQRSESLPENLRGITFYKKYSETEEVPRMIKRDDGPDKIEFHSRPTPTPRSTATEIDDFIKNIFTQTNNYLNTRRYLHDITVLFKRGPGQEGFWNQVAEFAKQISTTDIDNMMLLPDANVFMTAHNLYVKHLTQAFSKLNWIHAPDMFSADFFEVNTDIEKKVLEDLKKLFPEMGRNEPDKLQRALKMGVGMARGVTLAEVEIAASADPPQFLNSKGEREVSFESLYISDAAPLLAFRASYNAERFMPPDLTRGPLLFSLVSGFEKKRYWDHNEMWARMKAYEKSFLDGRQVFGIDDDSELLIDSLSNFAKVGGLEFRSGWRPTRGYDTWLRRIEDPDGVDRGKFDFLESWKQLENIGFIVLRNFYKVDIEHEPDGKQFLLDKRGHPGERDAFFQYLFDKYINYDPVTGGRATSLSLADEVSRAREEVKKIKPGIKGDDLEFETYKFIINKALFAVLRQRIPTYFIRLDRDRMSRKGEGAYKLILKSTGWDHLRLDSTMRNLEDVEMKLRLKVSDEMSEYLRDHDKDLADPNIEYVLTEQFIRHALGDILGEGSEDQINDAVKLFKIINNEFINDSNQFAQDRIRTLYRDKFKYTIGIEELERRFLAYRAAGDSPLHRATKDIGLIEIEVSKRLIEHLESLKKIARDPKRDFFPLIENLSKMKKAISILHGDVVAWEKMSELVGMTINYFRKDSKAKAFWGLWGLNRLNSLAAEFAGTSVGIYEWENHDIFNFFNECHKEGILPRFQHEYKKAPEWEEVDNKLLRFFGIKKKLVHKKEPKILTIHDAKKMFGGTTADIVKEYLWKYLPIVLAVMLWASISKAFKKEITGKDQ